MSGQGLVALAAALTLVLSFGLLREGRLPATLRLLRWHLASTTLAACAASFTAAPAEAAVLLTGAAVLLGLTARIGKALERFDQRTGGGAINPHPMTALPLIALGLGLTSLAVLAVTALPGAAGARQSMALGLAATLLGLVCTARASSPALCLARFSSLGNGLVLLACATPNSVALTSACLLLTPSVLLVAAGTIGRAGGLP